VKEVYGIVLSEDVRTLEIEIHPGDGTRYRFLVSEGAYKPDEFVTVANVEGLASGYPLRRDSIKEAYSLVTQVLEPRDDTHNIGEVIRTGEVDEKGEHINRFVLYPYVGYVASHIGMGGKDCNPWTARAAILAAYHAIKTWEDENARREEEYQRGEAGEGPEGPAQDHSGND
jgi:hypothetical protein